MEIHDDWYLFQSFVTSEQVTPKSVLLAAIEQLQLGQKLYQKGNKSSITGLM